MSMVKRTALDPRRSLFVIVASIFIQWGLPSAHAMEVPDRGPLQIWFVRHAESELNVATLPHHAADAGVTYPLTKRGMEQAIALADTHAAAPIVAIYSSTRLRAIQTSDALAFKHRLPLTLAPEAVEIELGVANDSPELGAIYQELRRQWLVERNHDARHGEGESLADVQRRFLPFVREVMNRHAHDSGVVIVMSHGATLGLLVPLVATNVPADFVLRHPLTNTGIIKTELKDNSLVCVEWLGVTPERFESTHP
jgi:2,3-bisphosphoglycerate-dependent phosphoglycerate mutase